MILFQRLVTHRNPSWPLYPAAPRGYLAGEPDPEGDPGEGLVTVNAVPGGREIEVRHRPTRTVVATTFSRPDGTWQVPDLPSLEDYDVIARDYAGVWDDVISGPWRPYVPD